MRYVQSIFSFLRKIGDLFIILICHLRRISISKVVLRSCFLRSLYNKQCCSLVIYDDHQHEQSLPWWPQRTRDPWPPLTPHWRPDQSGQTFDRTRPHILKTLTMSPKMEEFVGFNPRSCRKIVDYWQVLSILTSIVNTSKKKFTWTASWTVVMPVSCPARGSDFTKLCRRVEGGNIIN